METEKTTDSDIKAVIDAISGGKWRERRGDS